MKNTIMAILCPCFLLLWGCAMGPQSMLEPKPPDAAFVPKDIKDESDSASRDREVLTKYFEKKASSKLQVEPVISKYDPLEDHIVSFSMVDEDLQLVLYSLARSVGMNLIIDPEVKKEKHLVTLNFQNVSAATVLRELLKVYDLYHEVDQNVIRIKPYQEKTFRLNFLDTNVNIGFDVGGDVLGASETESSGGLSGNFKLSGKGASKSEALKKVRQSETEKDTFEQGANDSPPANVYTIRGLLFSPQGILGIAILVLLFGGMVYFAASYLGDMASREKGNIRQTPKDAAAYIPPEESHDTSGKIPPATPSVPPPPQQANYQKAQPGMLYLPPKAAPTGDKPKGPLVALTERASSSTAAPIIRVANKDPLRSKFLLWNQGHSKRLILKKNVILMALLPRANPHSLTAEHRARKKTP